MPLKRKRRRAGLVHQRARFDSEWGPEKNYTCPYGLMAGRLTLYQRVGVRLPVRVPAIYVAVQGD